jgi:hypothetical protein
MNPSLRSHHNSNLNIGCVTICDSSSDTSLVRARTMVKENSSSHYIVISIRYNFSKVGVAKLFTYVYFLLDMLRRIRLSMTALNIKCHLPL